jgi:hypothetical protein
MRQNSEGPSAFLLQPVSMGRLLGAIAADRHAAPPPRLSSGMVGEQVQL